VEFESREKVSREHPNGLRDFVGGGWLTLAPGEITDDTQMTLALLRGLTADGVDMDIVASEFVAWYHSNPKDIGNTTRAALRQLDAGMPWHEAGESVIRGQGPEAGAANGGVMRCAPVALRFRNDPEALVRVSLDTARITHAEARAKWGTVAVNQAIVHLLNGGAIADAPEAAIAGVEDGRVRDAVLSARTRRSEDVRAGGYVLETVNAAFWALLHTDSLEDAIVTAVAFGQDADTTGAVAGALAGAAYGASAIPARWLDLLQPRAELERHAMRLLELAG